MALVLVALNRQASQRGDFFSAATALYLLFEDPWAMQAAILGVLTADRDTRTAAIATLQAITRSPDRLVAPLLAADRERASPLQQAPALEAAAVVGRRSAHLATMIVRFDGNVQGIRADLARQAPRYARQLQDGMNLSMEPFTRLDPDAMPAMLAAMAADSRQHAAGSRQ